MDYGLLGRAFALNQYIREQSKYDVVYIFQIFEIPGIYIDITTDLLAVFCKILSWISLLENGFSQIFLLDLPFFLHLEIASNTIILI